MHSPSAVRCVHYDLNPNNIWLVQPTLFNMNLSHIPVNVSTELVWSWIKYCIQCMKMPQPFLVFFIKKNICKLTFHYSAYTVHNITLLSTLLILTLPWFFITYTTSLANNLLVLLSVHTEIWESSTFSVFYHYVNFFYLKIVETTSVKDCTCNRCWIWLPWRNYTQWL